MKIIKSRLFKALVLLFLFGFLLGIFSYFIDNSNSNIINYFSYIKSNNFDYLNGLLNSIIYNYKYAFIIFVLGFTLILSLIIPFIIVFRGISVGYTIISIIYTYKLKGLILALILSFPCVVINELIFLLISYYSIKISIKEMNSIKYNKSINLKLLIRNNYIIFSIFLLVLLLSSLFEIFISSNIIKFMI